MPQEVSEAQWFVLQICHLEIERTVKNRVLSLVQQLAGKRIYFQKSVLKKPVSIAIARALLDVRLPVVQIRNRLIDGRHAGSFDAAYRIIRLAIAERGKEKSYSFFTQSTQRHT
ncbi:MAG: hypothetical protein ACOYNF_18900 [Rhodoferax sp.]